jgi:threonylcarbamoyladenosine tRNA methylthiotransferase MtaB
MKFKMITLGCKVNQFESEAIAQTLKINGHREVSSNGSDMHDLEYCIINTCSVTRKAGMQSRQAIRKAIRRHPEARITVTGCHAQLYPEDIMNISGIYAVIGHSDKHRLDEFLDSIHADSPCIVCKDVKKETSFQSMKRLPMGSRTRAFLKIQDGCSSFCSYCVVPFARGPSRSLEPDAIMESLNVYRLAGLKEVVLTGIHLGAYGADLDPRTSLLKLLYRISMETSLDRIRLTSLEPKEITERMIELVGTWKGLCPHFHVPLQSGDDTILKRMKRPYDSTVFKDLILRIRKSIADAAIGVDIMVGFPGETDAAFENTLSLIEAVPVTYLHVFPFSPGKNTLAARMGNQVDGKVKKKRCEIMRQIGMRKQHDFFKTFLGKTLEVLVETQRGAGGYLKGFTDNYIQVFFEGTDELKNKVVPVKIVQVDSINKVVGQLRT